MNPSNLWGSPLNGDGSPKPKSLRVWCCAILLCLGGGVSSEESEAGLKRGVVGRYDRAEGSSGWIDDVESPWSCTRDCAVGLPRKPSSLFSRVIDRGWREGPCSCSGDKGGLLDLISWRSSLVLGTLLFPLLALDEEVVVNICLYRQVKRTTCSGRRNVQGEVCLSRQVKHVVIPDTTNGICPLVWATSDCLCRLSGTVSS